MASRSLGWLDLLFLHLSSSIRLTHLLLLKRFGTVSVWYCIICTGWLRWLFTRLFRSEACDLRLDLSNPFLGCIHLGFVLVGNLSVRLGKLALLGSIVLLLLGGFCGLRGYLSFSDGILAGLVRRRTVLVFSGLDLASDLARLLLVVLQIALRFSHLGKVCLGLRETLLCLGLSCICLTQISERLCIDDSNTLSTDFTELGLLLNDRWLTLLVRDRDGHDRAGDGEGSEQLHCYGSKFFLLDYKRRDRRGIL